MSPPVPAGNAGHWFDPASRGGPADHPGRVPRPCPRGCPGGRPARGPGQAAGRAAAAATSAAAKSRPSPSARPSPNARPSPSGRPLPSARRGLGRPPGRPGRRPSPSPNPRPAGPHRPAAGSPGTAAPAGAPEERTAAPPATQHTRAGGHPMALVTPVDTVPLDQLGRVHFVGIGGAGMSGIARVMLARGVAVSGSDSGSPAMVSELAALGARRAHRSRRGTPRCRRHGRGVQRDPAGQPRAGRGAPPRAARPAPRRRARLADDRPAGHGRRRHARQDHDNLDDHHHPA